ncbi:hypothetical protein DBV05_g12135 [Lasiodiplodia theobromae]|uniref:Uncharacterized protein n=1 Tax=Lasiodiplodia theobromae TaxID=45133 RepID=A0A5N5CV11_9PEZI|nr:hypothetical protein DBV05_g12135 [Lasiodiplodia theobromae]
MSALIDADFQKVLDAINDAVPLEGATNRFDCPESRSPMSWDFGLEAVSGGYGTAGMASSSYCSIPNTEEAFDRTGEDPSLQGSKANEDADSVQALQEELSKIQAELQELKRRIDAELQELKRMVEAGFEIYGQRITSTEKYLDELLPWTQEVHGAIEQLTGSSANADKAGQAKFPSVQDLSENV